MTSAHIRQRGREIFGPEFDGFLALGVSGANAFAETVWADPEPIDRDLDEVSRDILRSIMAAMDEALRHYDVPEEAKAFATESALRAFHDRMCALADGSRGEVGHA
ncbi:hypothetical protein [Methylobacterium platani]|uniref:Uncharacterized protein n=2 Tax=Methylobacterium platani TaxID=427683 RepID=A0A179S3A4_9HYPH|nr:hypothetical protein [Methylobacterium platani]KMO21620.1 hypothetical protein SQ03_02825 [Methylobacterium platani JCM 14648]OAS19105.1 hypothetical protein A5481_25255 [Methylobacterium platani]